ncbi:Xaa-Pro peptidase family protein [Nocardioides ginsengisoli]|uniref:M24 family metallopeptidase n=1 Tax=Nocardioides ginsengisoli TaxID=363868 RepID=A0ABW3VVA5_9ACTN
MTITVPTAVQLGRTAELLERSDLDAIVVSSRQAMRHLANLYLPHLSVLSREEQMFFICTRRGDHLVIATEWMEPYAAEKSQLPCVAWDFGADPIARLASELTRLGVASGAIGIETKHVTVADAQRYGELLPGVTWHGIDDELMLNRQIKTPDEIRLMDEVAKAGERAMVEAIGRGWVGMTDREFQMELRVASIREGVDEVAWLALNWATLDQRTDPTDRPIEPGQVFSIEFGLSVDGYYSDLQRTVAAGDVADEVASVYRDLMQVQDRTIAAMQPGVSVGEMHAKFEADMANRGLTMWDWWLGHTMGLDVHEGGTIWLRDGSETVFRPGMVFAVEPVVTTPALLAIEDNVVIEEAGPRLLSNQFDWSEIVRLGESAPTR